MAVTYKNLAQAQAAYDTILKQKQRVLRNDEINQQKAILGVNNYLKQQGYNGGAAESILLRARGNRTDISNYDAQLAELAAIISALSQPVGGGGGGGSSRRNTSGSYSSYQQTPILGTGKLAGMPSTVYFDKYQKGNPLYDSKAANTYVPTGSYTISTKNGQTVSDTRFKQPVVAAVNAAKKAIIGNK